MSTLEKTCESCDKEFSSFVETVCDACHDKFETDRNKAYTALMAEAVKLAAALEKQPDKLEYTGDIAREALKQWQAFLDDKGE